MADIAKYVLMSLMFIVVSASAGHAQMSSYFRLHVCNHSYRYADVAVHSMQFNAWIVSGWYRVNPGQCITVGTFQKANLGIADLYARDTSGTIVWDGYAYPNPNEMRLCLDYPGPFRRFTTSYSDAICLPHQRMHYMRTVLVTSGNFTWDLF